jgi:phenylacetate-CoA ligase
VYEKIANLLFYPLERSNGRRACRCQKRLERTQWLKKDQLQELKFRKLKVLLKHAYDNVPYYHESFKQAKFKPSDFRQIDDLSKVPILNRHVMRDHIEEMLARNIQRNQLVGWSTSGTTSLPVRFFRDPIDISWGIGAELRGYGWAGYTVGAKVVRVWSVKPKELASFSFRLKRFLKREKLLNVTKLSEKSMDLFAKEMKRFKPSFIRGQVAGINIFANFLLRNDYFKIRPKAVFTTTATLFPHYRRTIEQAFGCKVYDNYACSEVSHVAAQCNESEGLHVSEENVMVEVVDGYEPVAEGEDGKILLTNLNGFSMPFIRYDVGDLGTVLDDECSCGRELGLIKVIGREYEHFLNNDGSFTSLKDLETFFEDVPLQDFQIVQETCDDIVVKIVPKHEYTLAHSEFISKNLKMRGSANVQVELVGSIPLGSSGKIERVVKSVNKPDYFAKEPFGW